MAQLTDEERNELVRKFTEKERQANNNNNSNQTTIPLPQIAKPTLEQRITPAPNPEPIYNSSNKHLGLKGRRLLMLLAISTLSTYVGLLVHNLPKLKENYIPKIPPEKTLSGYTSLENLELEYNSEKPIRIYDSENSYILEYDLIKEQYFLKLDKELPPKLEIKQKKE